MIAVNGLVKVYKGVTVLNIPELNIARGESFGLVGNNGAGKTTLFRMILDLVLPLEGEVLLQNENVRQSENWKQFTGSYLDEGFLIDYLTPNEYFNFIGSLHGLHKAEVAERLRKFSDFFNDEILDKPKYIRDLSKGNQNKVGIAAALLIEPQLLILDEPFANLDPTTQIRLKNLLRELKEKRQLTMLISSHDLNHVTEVCDRIVILNKGQLVDDIRTSADTLKELEAYFAV
ncbi:ABC transporter ATP-binding protein [Adhaeribacter sp. BT258]|uniref:ABC transporter ATP-binding protein n=1 Tax=Adhaeribacter terrigena TaxID=2793070 RepID=A0ABS1C233_9BACT|nr:ABC transporter ATP-binding protein [Adhaeribacter terrigena]MBK0403459.1 ABC transporter ATP-binding protein [Adhaeribacter terrigena]